MDRRDFLGIMAGATAAAALGRCRISAAVAARGAVAKDWPFWYGPNGNFSAAPSGCKLIDSLAEAKLAWKSEEALPPAKAQSMRYGAGNVRYGKGGGGGCSPVVAGGFVYLFYFVPSGDVYDEAYVRKLEAQGAKVIKEQWLIHADDCVICIDARNGKTVWKTVFKEKGINWHDAKAGPCNTTPCVSDGRIYAIGTTGRVYCLDAKTGKEAWQSNLGPRFRQIEQKKKQCLTRKSLGGHSLFNRDHGGAVTFADGVVVMPDFAGRTCGLLALDARTGKERWRIPKAASKEATPMRWAHKGREYLISANAEGRVICLEPGSGKALWQIEHAGYNPRTVVASEDSLVLNIGPPPVRRQPKPTGQLGCYRIEPRGFKKLWALPPDYGYPRGKPVVIYDGHAYARLPERIACVELATGKIAAEVRARHNSPAIACAADGRLLIDVDGAHRKTELMMFNADPHGFKQLGESWKPPHPHTTSYYVAMSHPYVGGRLYIRGADGVYCYDLRQSAGT